MTQVGRVLLERGRELAELAAAAGEAGAGAGSVVLICGEAGIGKSALAEAIRGVLPARGRLLAGYCDDLATRRTLGPIRDLAGSVGPRLTEALAEGRDRNELLEALRAEVSWAGQPTVLVIEDVHWADEATLDVLRYLVRRVAGLPLVLVLTYRDDEIGRDHPLRDLLGLVSRTERVRRLPLARLSRAAVATMTAEADRVWALTSGNPFFVVEVVAAGDARRPPPTVIDAVLARIRGVDPATQDALEQLAVVPSASDRWLVDRLVPGGVAALATAERHGLVTVAPARVTFRHELIRRAVADSLPAARRIGLNQRVVGALLDRDGGDLSAIVHHAVEAGDAEVITRYAPRAAAEASAAGSHREAVGHLRLALEHRVCCGRALGRGGPAGRDRGELGHGRAQPGAGGPDPGGRPAWRPARRRTGGRAWEVAAELRELQRTGPAAAVRAEAHWLGGTDPGAVAVLERIYAQACELGVTENEAELAYWMTRLGRPVRPVAGEHPYALQAAGRHHEAAAAWRAAGCPYEYAAALADGDDVDDLLAALAELDKLDAASLARRVRTRLRELGLARVPRGPTDGTRQNPAGLTDRQVQVLRLLEQGHTNPEIADRLVLSVRTIDAHVAAVLGKLGLRSRREVVARAAGLGGSPGRDR